MKLHAAATSAKTLGRVVALAASLGLASLSSLANADGPSAPAPLQAKSVVAESKGSGLASSTPRVVPAWMDVPGDSPMRVHPAPPEVTRVIVYLHGRCSSSDKIQSWAPDASRLGTIV